MACSLYPDAITEKASLQEPDNNLEKGMQQSLL